MLAAQQPPVANEGSRYPDGYRNWAHVKARWSVPPAKTLPPSVAFNTSMRKRRGDGPAIARNFPEGSIVVFDWLEMRDNNGAFEEGPRRQVDVMVKDSQRFAKTGG